MNNQLEPEETELKPLEQYDSERMAFHTAIFYPARPVKNGIACPCCGAELVDTNPMAMLTSLPPRKQIHCEQCTYQGSRIA